MFVVRRSRRRCRIRRCVCLSVGSGSSLRRCSCLLACLLAHKTFALEGVKSLSWVSKREGGRVLEIWMTGKKAVSIS